MHTSNGPGEVRRRPPSGPPGDRPPDIEDSRTSSGPAVVDRLRDESLTGQREVAVIGAAGPTGRRVLEALAARGQPATALVHGRDRASMVMAAGAARWRACDFEDPQSLSDALKGIASLLIIPPGMAPREDEYVINTVDAARRAGVARLVFHSVLHPHTTTMQHHLRKARAEEAVRASGLEWSILQPAMYAQTALFYAANSPAAEVWAPFDIDSSFTAIDVQDVAEAAATVMLDDGHLYASYELAGPQVMTFREMVAGISQVRGEPLTPRSVYPWEFARSSVRLIERMPDFVAMCYEYSRHGMLGNPRVAAMLLGRELRTFLDVVRREMGEVPT